MWNSIKSISWRRFGASFMIIMLVMLSVEAGGIPNVGAATDNSGFYTFTKITDPDIYHKDAAVITGYNGPSTDFDLEVPDELYDEDFDGPYVVIEIDALFGQEGVRTYQSVELPESLRKLGGNAFIASELKSLKMGDRIKYIGKNAFAHNNLKSINLPSSITEIKERAFEDNQIESLNIPSKLKNIEAKTFKDNSLQNITIPEGHLIVESIGNQAFFNNNLKEVEIPSNVMGIETEAFASNPLERVLILGNPTFGDEVFSGYSDDFTLYGYKDKTRVQTYAAEAGLRFFDIETVEADFSPNGMKTSGAMSSEVTIERYPAKDDDSLPAYVWTNSQAEPGKLAGWMNFSSGDTLTLSEDSEIGEWYLHVKAKNYEGEEVINTSAPFILEDPAPDISMNLTLMDGSTYTADTWTKQDVTVTLQAESDTVENMQYRMNEKDAWETYNGPFDIVDEGMTTIYARGVDVEGNTSETETVVKIDRTSPSKPEIETSSTGWTNADFVTLALMDGEDGTDESGVARTEYRIDAGGDWTVYDEEESLVVTDEDETTVFARTIDKAENVSDEAEAVVQIDRTNPDLELTGENEIEVELGVSYEDLGATATDNLDKEINEKINTKGDVNTNQVGTYKVTYSVEDHAGNPSRLERTVHVVDTTPPNDVTLTEIDKTTDSMTLEMSASDLSGIDSYVLTRDGEKIATIDGDQSTFTDEGLESGKMYTYTVIAVDEYDNESKAVSIQVATVPVITEVADIPEITVDYGTRLKEVPLPEEVTATLSDRTEVNVPVQWDKGIPAYDKHIAQIYEFTGTIAVPEGVVNKKDLVAKVMVGVEKPGTMENVPGAPPKLVYPEANVAIKGMKTLIQLPADLPEGTMLGIETVDDRSFGGHVPVGEMFSFVFNYPDGHEEYTGTFTLTLGVDEDAVNPAIYHYNEQTGEWEYIGGEVRDGQITATVNHFSAYGVFAKEPDETEEPPGDSGDKDTGNGDNEEDDKDSNDGKGGNNIGDRNDKSGNKGEKSDLDRGDGDSLPKTATNHFNWILIGFLSLVLAAVMWFLQRKRHRAE